jgi:broad specificity phosphatase PhoE
VRVFIVRHGESEANAKDIWSGWLDFPLTKKGRDDARAAQKYLTGIPFDKIYSSDLKRAYETCEVALPGAIPELSPLLREINIGSLAGTPRSAKTNEERLEVSKNGYPALGGETREEFKNRIRQFKRELEGSSADFVIVFSHAGWLRGFLDIVIDVHIPAGKVLCNNCAIGVFDYNDGAWRLHSWINSSDVYQLS